MTPSRLTLSGITKVYPAVVANKDVDLVVLPGEIHAVLGENGAGKSTLMKIIYGAVKPTAGTIAWEGKAVTIANPARARRLGIGMVFQHFSLFETLTVADNIALALEHDRTGADLPARITEVSAKYGLPLDPARYVHTMSVGERQRVEIVRCLLQDPRLLIMDEPTSVLTPQAVEKLFETLRRLAAEGCSILYISHKLDEIRALCHKATVLRGGRVTGTCDPRQESSSSLARMMIGADLPHPQHREAKVGADALVVRNLTLPGRRSVWNVAREHQPHRARRGDRRHRRRVRQRAEGVDGRAFRREAAARRRHRDRARHRRRPHGRSTTPLARLCLRARGASRPWRSAGNVAHRQCVAHRLPQGDGQAWLRARRGRPPIRGGHDSRVWRQGGGPRRRRAQLVGGATCRNSSSAARSASSRG